MAKQVAVCPICGKQFVPCQTELSAFNWRRVVCSQSCAQEYMDRIAQERAEQRRQNIDQALEYMDQLEQERAEQRRQNIDQ